MLLELAPGWTTDVDRGPDWLFVRLHGPENGEAEGAELAERLWRLLEREFAHRLVLELDDVPLLRSALIGELVRLQKRIATQGGILRLCGLSSGCREALHACRLGDRFPQYRDRTEAVMGLELRKPR